MSFEVEKNENYAIIKFQFMRFNSTMLSALKAELRTLNSEGFNNIIFDLTHVRFCGSLGLTLILIAHRLCKTSNGKLVLTGLQDRVKKIITISQLDTILTITNYLPDALLEVFGAQPVVNI